MASNRVTVPSSRAHASEFPSGANLTSVMGEPGAAVLVGGSEAPALGEEGY
jgi:hypothetical protein